MSRFLKWSQREHPFRARMMATLLAGILFLIILPYLLLGMDVLTPGIASILVGGILMAIGFFFGFWSILLQLTQGRGTPFPMMPTQGLLTNGPFRFCRNPMTFGAVSAYLGMAVAAVTPVGVALVLSLASLLVVYLKRVEEKELAERFGQPYLDYLRTVPFLLPRWPKSG
jgi:protein-S-isoprenylcysteine O-methyltransferase Ste14